MELTFWESFWLVLKLASPIATLKLYIAIQSLRFYGVFNLYRNRELIFNHSIFSKLDRLYTDQELFNRISDIARREIFKDVFKAEIHGLNEIILSFRESLYSDYGFFKFMFKNKRLDSRSMMDIFLRLYNAHRDKLEKQIRFKLIRGGLEPSRIIYIIQKFYEFTDENSFMLREKIAILKNRNNLFFVITDLFDRLEIEIEASRKFLPGKFQTLNGRLDGINYKGYETFNESKPKVKISEDVMI